MSGYWGQQIFFTDWARLEGGLRGDVFFFDVRNRLPQQNIDPNFSCLPNDHGLCPSSGVPVNDDGAVLIKGNEVDGLASPKVNLVLGPWYNTEVYANFGYGFHSNDARGVILTGTDGLVPALGYELGSRTRQFDRLDVAAALWLHRSRERAGLLRRRRQRRRRSGDRSGRRADRRQLLPRPAVAPLGRRLRDPLPVHRLALRRLRPELGRPALQERRRHPARADAADERRPHGRSRQHVRLPQRLRRLRCASAIWPIGRPTRNARSRRRASRCSTCCCATAGATSRRRSSFLNLTDTDWRQSQFVENTCVNQIPGLDFPDQPGATAQPCLASGNRPNQRLPPITWQCSPTASRASRSPPASRSQCAAACRSSSDCLGAIGEVMTDGMTARPPHRGTVSALISRPLHTVVLIALAATSIRLVSEDRSVIPLVIRDPAPPPPPPGRRDGSGGAGGHRSGSAAAIGGGAVKPIVPKPVERPKIAAKPKPQVRAAPEAARPQPTPAAAAAADAARSPATRRRAACSAACAAAQVGGAGRRPPGRNRRRRVARRSGGGPAESDRERPTELSADRAGARTGGGRGRPGDHRPRRRASSRTACTSSNRSRRSTTPPWRRSGVEVQTRPRRQRPGRPRARAAADPLPAPLSRPGGLPIRHAARMVPRLTRSAACRRVRGTLLARPLASMAPLMPPALGMIVELGRCSRHPRSWWLIAIARQPRAC